MLMQEAAGATPQLRDEGQQDEHTLPLFPAAPGLWVT